MLGPAVLVRSLSTPSIKGKRGNVWQYHSRSDRHSKVACWGVMFDLLRTSPLLRQQVRAGTVGFGINHQMRDYSNGRKKDLDLVLCRRDAEEGSGEFAGLVDKYGIRLTDEEADLLCALPPLYRCKPQRVLMALEAKACMTAHIKAIPRLFDELNSSHLTIHGAAEMAIAVGLVMINSSDWFVSPDINKWDLKKLPAEVTTHKQPKCVERVVRKVAQLGRRGHTGETGYDAVGIVLVDGRNDGTPFRLAEPPPSVAPTCDLLSYQQMVLRIAQLYESRFPAT